VNDRQNAGEQGLRAVHIIRDPLEMVASGYCYHHAGNEREADFNGFAPLNIESLNATEGVPLVAERMENVIKSMVEAFMVSDSKDTYVVRYENLTRSSPAFDYNIAMMFDFLFGGLITPAEMQQIKIEAQVEDLNRGQDGYSDDGHVSDDECKLQARAALQYIPTALYAQFEQQHVVPS